MPPKKPTAVPKKPTAAIPKKATPAKKTGANGGKKTTPVSSQKKGATSSKDAKDVTDKLAKMSTTDEQPKPVIIEIELKDLSDVLKDDDGKIKSTGKWPMIVDSGGRASVFLRYQGGNCLDAISPSDMQAETIRKRLIGSIRFVAPRGSPLCVSSLSVCLVLCLICRREQKLGFSSKKYTCWYGVTGIWYLSGGCRGAAFYDRGKDV
nr:IQ motif and ankyrin repeat domain-containing protein 1-like [Lytechinus pictus]